MIRSSVLFVAAKSTQKPPGAANFCIREWRPRTPVSYHLDFALEGRRATIASRGRRPHSIGAWLLDTGYCLSKGWPGNSQGAMVALVPDGLGEVLPFPASTRACPHKEACAYFRETGVERAEGPSWGFQRGKAPLAGCKGSALAGSPEGSALWRGSGAKRPNEKPLPEKGRGGGRQDYSWPAIFL